MNIKKYAKVTGLGIALAYMLMSCEILTQITPPDYNYPEANINITTQGLPGLPGRYAPFTIINFEGSASLEGDEAIAGYTWDFGDGSAVGNGEYVSHSFSTSGIYRVTLTVSDILSQTGDDIRDIIINAPPEAVISPIITTAVAGEEITLRSDGSTDSDGTLENFSWDLDDGTTNKGTLITHTYTSPGDYTIALTVTDNRGTTNTAYTAITVTLPPNELPEANAGSDMNIDFNTQGSPVTLDGSASHDSDGTIVSWVWSFNSLPAGSTLTDNSLTNLGEGRASFNVSGENESAMAEGSLSYGLTLTVTDNQGGIDSDTVHIHITGTGSVIIDVQ